jgi:hypothetical protein
MMLLWDFFKNLFQKKPTKTFVGQDLYGSALQQPLDLKPYPAYPGAILREDLQEKPNGTSI